jgi:hypothetical protein
MNENTRITMAADRDRAGKSGVVAQSLTTSMKQRRRLRSRPYCLLSPPSVSPLTRRLINSAVGARARSAQLRRLYRSSHDSSQEEDGFAPLVPTRRSRPLSRRSSRHGSRDRRQATERRPLRASRICADFIDDRSSVSKTDDRYPAPRKSREQQRKKLSSSPSPWFRRRHLRTTGAQFRIYVAIAQPTAV